MTIIHSEIYANISLSYVLISQFDSKLITWFKKARPAHIFAFIFETP